MVVYPDGEALSAWERRILEDIEREMERSDPRLVSAFLSQGDRRPSPALTAYAVVAETAVALAVVSLSMAGTMAGLASLWVAAAAGFRTTPRRAHRRR